MLRKLIEQEIGQVTDFEMQFALHSLKQELIQNHNISSQQIVLNLLVNLKFARENKKLIEVIYESCN
jgi:hypothetical protein